MGWPPDLRCVFRYAEILGYLVEYLNAETAAFADAAGNFISSTRWLQMTVAPRRTTLNLGVKIRLRTLR